MSKIRFKKYNYYNSIKIVKINSFKYKRSKQRR